MLVANNPAGRLHDLLKEALGHNSGETCRTVWGSVLRVNHNDTGAILHGIYEIVSLTRTAKEEFDRIEGIDRHMYFRPFNRVESALARIELDGKWETARNLLDENTLTGIKFCSDFLSREAAEAIIQHEELAELQRQVEELLRNVESCALSDALRAVLIDHLETIRSAILNYRIHGNRGLRRALDTGIGTLLRHSTELQEQGKNSVVARFSQLLRRVDQLVATAAKVKQLFAPLVAGLLGFDEAKSSD